MIIEKEDISNESIKLGDLFFILHTSKPMKTGWYRKVRTDNIGVDCFVVFEKSVHPNFNAEDKSLSHSRRTDGIFHMLDTTLKSTKSYKILVKATGIMATRILMNDYKVPFTSKEELSKALDISISENGLYVLDKLHLFIEEDKPPQMKHPYAHYVETILEGKSY